jgi:hypothetical protein
MPAIGQYRIIRDQIWINGSTDKVNQLDLAAMGMTACALQQKQNRDLFMVRRWSSPTGL